MLKKWLTKKARTKVFSKCILLKTKKRNHDVH
jgi:hypothetical protein